MDSTKKGAAALMVALLLGVVTASSVVAQPTNDDIAAATEVTGIPFADAIDTNSATSDPTDPTDCHNNGSVWYVFTPPTDVVIEANTIGSDYDTTLGVYSGSPGSLTLLDCNDDFYGLQARVSVAAVGGTTYYFMAGFCCGNGFNGGGSLSFNVLEAPPPVEVVELTADPTGNFDSHTGTATVHGTVMCNIDASGTIDGMLRQKVGRLFITGFFSVPIDCTSSGGPWTATVTGDGLFKGGMATLTANVFACNALTCDDASIGPVTVKLRAN